jgi:HEPN domain-containing protein
VLTSQSIGPTVCLARLWRLLAVGLMVLCVSGSTVAAPDAAQLEKDIQFVHRMVNDSEAARKIASDTNEEAKTLQQQANDYLQQARDALQAGDMAKTSQLLGQAKLTMFQAMRSVGGEVKSQKQQDDFQRRWESANSLLQAHNRYAEENKLNGDAVKTAQHVEEILSKARKEFASGKRDSASQMVEDAYLSIKLSLTRLRTGQTVISALNFANKEEEYRYELDRNDTHKMLVKVVLKEKLNANPGLAKLVAMNMKIAEDLRSKARNQAEEGDFDAAVKTLEDSTSQIIRAIRAAGIYIPG